MLKLVNDPNQAKEMGLSGREFVVNRFSSQSFQSDLKDILDGNELKKFE